MLTVNTVGLQCSTVSLNGSGVYEFRHEQVLMAQLVMKYPMASVTGMLPSLS